MNIHKNHYFAIAILGVCFASLFCIDQSFAAQGHEAQVVWVNDGDTVTIRMEDSEYRTRLIGIDAPEMGQEPWGKKAKKHLIELMKQAHWIVFVETDVVKYDKYDRLLAYLWTSDNEMLNERMLKDGYAVLFTIQPNSKYADRFRKAQRAAREQKLGIWGPDGLKERPLDYKKKHPRMENVHQRVDGLTYLCYSPAIVELLVSPNRY
jgi:micrococcal nuclease